LLVLDHHKSAQETCGDLDFCTFDMNHSGAYLAWAYLFPDDNVPLLIRYIEDRDLWKWEMEHGKEILSVVDSVGKTFDEWDYLDAQLDAKESVRFNRVKAMGEGILSYKENLINSLLKNSYRINVLGYDVPVVNAPFFQSEMAAELAQGEPFAAAYYFNGTEYRFSLRSTDEGEDVSEIAIEFGGGGHRNASGFLLTDLSVLTGGKLIGEKNGKLKRNKSKVGNQVEDKQA
jgi:oligoribonuclease NrnB/cAMP/cGMP phosphodiesterase (DHH superfamily)